MKKTVARLMDEARRRAGGGKMTGQDDALAVLIQPLVGRLYRKQAISTWALGKVMPPASVLLAACKVTGISIDSALYGEDAIEERLKRIEKAMGLTTDH